MSMADLLKKSLEAQRVQDPQTAQATDGVNEAGVPKDYRAIVEQRERDKRTFVHKDEQKSIEKKEYDFSKVKSLSSKTLEAHVGLYENYVARYNEVVILLKKASKDKSDAAFSQYAEVRRRYSFLWNAVCLHDLYFRNIGKAGVQDEVGDKIGWPNGSFEAWKQDFTACAMGTHGWVVLAKDADGDMVNFTMDDHQTGMICSVTPILVLDAYEHAYWADFTGDKRQYVEKFFEDINWPEVASRFENND